MQCPVCNENGVKLLQALKASRWKHVYCTNCNADIIARPITHVLMSLVIPLGFWLPIVISGGGSLNFLVSLLIVGVFLAIGLASVVFRFLPLAVRDSRSYKVELALVLLSLVSLITFATVNHK